MTRLTYPRKEENRQAHLQLKEASTQEAGQILHLKRLLVTVKQHYEKSLHQLQIQLQAEQSQRLAAQKEIESLQAQLIENQQLHAEELQALRQQQNTLKEILKKTQDESALIRNQFQASEESGEDQSLQSTSWDKDIVLLREQTEKANAKIEQLHEELNSAQKKVKEREHELLENQKNAQKEIEQLRQLLEDQKLQGDELETVVSTTSSHYLRRELEMIKQTLGESAKESKALEARYIDTLNEKVELDHQCKQLKQQLEHQSSNLTAFQEQLHELENRKKTLEISLQTKEAEWIESCQQRQELQIQIENVNSAVKEKELIQDKYEQLKDEWKQINERLEETIEARQQMDVHLNQLEAIAANQETQLQEFAEQLQLLHQGKEILESERDQLKILLEESEARLKVAQQHLAKKVKEAALLSEKLEEQQAHLTDLAQTIEDEKTQIAQLQTSVELYERQEKRLQEQLNEALKGTESQITKWEEKYFRMYDKWQESEKRVRELKKFEEKHVQMQGLLANLGNFMGGAFGASPPPLFHAEQELDEHPSRPFFENSLSEEPLAEKSQTDFQGEKYNLFGMPQPPHKD